MSLIAMILFGMAMSTDGFAAALGMGASLKHPRWSVALRVGFIFGLVETITPLMGWLIGWTASNYITSWGHWAAFGLLMLLGMHMVYQAYAIRDGVTEGGSADIKFGKSMLAALATSIDGMIAGAALAFVNVNVAAVSLAIGLCTFFLATIGIMLGCRMGLYLGRRAEIAGGIVLMLIGTTILIGHPGAAHGT
jgi:putative Mn2+ efflux pump MntP